MAEVQGLTPAEMRRKTLVGHVVSDKMDKTVVVVVERLTRHPLYHKTMKQTRRFLAHDEHEVCQVGDRVRIVETRPQSRRKRWRVVEIIAHGSLVHVEEEVFADISSAEEEAGDVDAEPTADEAADAVQDIESEVVE